MAQEQDIAGGDRRPRPLETASAAVEGAADGLADGIEREGLAHSLPRVAGETAPIAQRGIRSERLRARLDKAEEKVSHAVEATRVKARAVAESARRARRAPPQILADVRDAAKAYASGVASSLGFYAAAGLVAAIALVVLTVALIQGLNGLWGKPWGTFAVGLAYGLGALILLGAARGKAEAGRQTAQVRLQQARHEARQVVEPLREAFRREPGPEARAATPTTTRLGGRLAVGYNTASTASTANTANIAAPPAAPLAATPVARDPGVSLDDLPAGEPSAGSLDSLDSRSTEPTGRDAP